jgi:hypothetical protein
MIQKEKKQKFIASYRISYGITKSEILAFNVNDAINQLPKKALKNLYSLVDSQGNDYINLFI